MSGCLRGPREGYQRCLFYRTVQEDSPQPYDPPSWVYDLPPFEEWKTDRGNTERLMRSARSGTWWIEHPCHVDDLNDPEGARDELFRMNYTFWNYMKNTWPERKRLERFRLDYVPFMVGKRESRRLMGDYVLNQNDMESGRPFEDAIGHTGWTLDVHALDGLFSTTGPFYCHTRIPLSQIPYRSLYSRNIDNLLMAGRTMSVTHIALGTVRVEGQTSLTGQAAGTAAALALHRNTTPRGVYQNHCEELQQLLLKNDHYVPGVRNLDPDDLARGASVRASSTQTEGISPYRAHAPGKARWFALSTPRGVCFPWQDGTTMESVSLPLQAEADTTVTLRVRQTDSPDDLSSTKDVAVQSLELRAGTTQWVEFPVDAPISAPFAWILVEPNEAVKWRYSRLDVPGVSRFFGSGSSRQILDDQGMAFDVSPAVPFSVEDAYIPGNVVNGVARTTEEAANFWLSDRDDPLPQWVELTLERPAAVSMIQCVFDTDLSVSLAKQRGTTPGVTVRSYRIQCRVDGRWQTVAADDENVQRWRRHRFEPVTTDKIRLVVDAMHGAPQARVLEMRVYEDPKPILA